MRQTGFSGKLAAVSPKFATAAMGIVFLAARAVA
jgi:hypothetical protein